MDKLGYIRHIFPEYGEDKKIYTTIKIALKRTNNIIYNYKLKTVAHRNGIFYKIVYFTNIYASGKELVRVKNIREISQLEYAVNVCIECHSWNRRKHDIVLGRCICDPNFQITPYDPYKNAEIGESIYERSYRQKIIELCGSDDLIEYYEPKIIELDD